MKPSTNKSKLIFIHDFDSDASSWTSVIKSIEEERISEQFDIYKFEYVAPWTSDSLSIKSIAADFAEWIEQNKLYSTESLYKTFITDHLFFVCHGLGGLILFQTLEAYREKNTKGAHNTFLRRVREIILFSTPLKPTIALAEITLYVSTKATGVKLRSQTEFLQRSKIEIEEIIHLFNEHVISPTDYFPNEIPISVLYFYGDKVSDGMQLPSWFPEEVSFKIPGDKKSLISFDAKDTVFDRFKSFLFNPIGHQNVFEIDQMNMSLSVEPLPAGPSIIKYGKTSRSIYSENRGINIKSVVFSKQNICNGTYTLRYSTTAPGGGISATYFPVDKQTAIRKKINLYEREGKEFTFDFIPEAGTEYNINIVVYKGFDGIQNQNSHFHIGNGKNHYKHISLKLDLTKFPINEFSFIKAPQVYLFGEDNHSCADTPAYRIPEYIVAPFVANLDKRIWEWEFYDIRSGVIDLVWELEAADFLVLEKPKETERTVRIFLASSNELTSERIAFQNLINAQNIRLAERKIWLELVVWETESGALSLIGSQAEYEKLIPGCDIFVGLFFSRLGKYTLREFQLALKTLCETKTNPLICLYFKDDQISSREILQDGRDLLELSDLLLKSGHFKAFFKDIADLERQFIKEIENCLKPRTEADIDLLETICNSPLSKFLNPHPRFENGS